ncbi:MAG TPA: radical SAM protein, partial [Tepidisphaeraceae bacterium]|nr:radical SAM protein [Tepidisphaeraceae bacterium]
MNVLLIWPEFPDTFWSFKHALKFLRRRATLPPLGLLTVGAMLPAGWNKRLIDLNVERLTEGDLAWADCAFIGAMIVQTESVRRVIARCKRAGVKVVAGGPLFTGTQEQFSEVDHFVLNEAEVTLGEFLADLEKGCAKRVYKTEQMADLCQTPAPMWELADLQRYVYAGVQYSRGCPYNCEFCNVTALFGRKPRTKGADQMIRELDSLRRAGWRGPIFFVDDNLIGSPRRAKEELLPALIEWQKRNGPVGFNAQVSINLADDEELMGMMVQAGFNTVFIGIETPDNQSLAECNKTQNRNRDLIADVKRIHRAGLQVQGGFIVGFDSDTPSIFQRQMEFIQNHHPIPQRHVRDDPPNADHRHAPPQRKHDPLLGRLFHRRMILCQNP